MSQTVKPTYTILADNPKTGAQEITGMLGPKGAEDEAKRLKRKGRKNIKITPTRNAAGSAG